MGFVPRPPPASHAATLSSLTNEPLDEPTSISRITFAQDQEQRDDEDLEDTGPRPDCIRSSASSSYSLDKALSEPPYHVFTLAKKKQLVYIVSLAGLFSPLSSNIYFPALGQIATDLKTSISLISLTITVYMVVQGLAPSFWGPLSDTQGRRITFIGTFAVYLLANIGLGFSNSFAALMVFRGIQAAGSAATISVGAGVIGDITTARERGGLIGVFGGSDLGSITLLLILSLLPETLRSVAGNGTLRLAGIHRPLIYTFSPPSDALIDRDSTPKKKLTLSCIVAPLKSLFEKDVFITPFFGSIVYTVWSMVTSSTTSLFQSRFHLNDLQIGLAFLPNGAGCVTGSYLTGYLMDNDYRVIELQYRTSRGIPEDTKLNKKDLVDFPIEKSRLRNIWWIVLIFILATAGYGFSLNLNLIALPLILQFFIAYTATAVFSLNSALVIDLYPGASASATAVNNLMRCTVGAAGVAVVQIVINGVGAGFAFLGFAVVTAGASPLLALEWFYGEGWRWERRERLKAGGEKRIDNVENAEVASGK
ncbi:MFS general substrate transporter [Hyaloscypha bicolor E]|uniref:MFS general substrate transporter n=1 Tax=Hyaloscypha bicolor E TaxID=1095630 RepID=A0A2J6SVR5_9HELO|nr:MFS general substrate transporter [Hyaloscypha bicolor E]PMD54872.1 MFS general substrate transporter [Hyaloscypha bicolor E]